MCGCDGQVGEGAVEEGEVRFGEGSGIDVTANKLAFQSVVQRRSNEYIKVLKTKEKKDKGKHATATYS